MICEDTLLPASHVDSHHPIDDYEVVRQIGSGSFGDVFLVRHTKEQRQYVMKTITLFTTMDQKQRESTELEVRLLSIMRHPNIVAYRDSFGNRDGHLCIFMEHCEHGDVYSYMREAKEVGWTPDERLLLEWFIQIVWALSALHQKRILHRDLKTQNIFLTGVKAQNLFALKIGDFGIAKVLDSTTDLTKTQIGTPFYMSPELINNKPYSYKSDIWGLGCVLYELINGHYAFEARSLNGLAFKIMRGRYTPITANCSEDSQALIKAMLSMNPGHRPSLQEILHLPFLRRKVPAVFQQVLSLCLPEARADSEQVLTEQLASLGLSRLVNHAVANHRDSRKLQQRLERVENRRRREEQTLNKLEHSAATIAHSLRVSHDKEHMNGGATASSLGVARQSMGSTAGFAGCGTYPEVEYGAGEAIGTSRFWAEPQKNLSNADHGPRDDGASSRRPDGHREVHARFDLNDEAQDGRSSFHHTSKSGPRERRHRSISPARTSPEPFAAGSSTNGAPGPLRLRALTELPSDEEKSPSDPALSSLLDYKHITPANLANPFQQCRKQVVHSPRFRMKSRSPDPQPPPPQFGKAQPPSTVPPNRRWTYMRSGEAPITATRSMHSVALESLNADRTTRDTSEDSMTDLFSDGAVSEGLVLDTGRCWGGAEAAREVEGLQQRIDHCKAALSRRQMTIETLQYRLAEAQAAETGNWSALHAEPPHSSRPQIPEAAAPGRPAMPAIVQDRLVRSIRCCLEGLGAERFHTAKQCLEASVDAAETPQVLRQNMLDLLGLDKIGYYSLIDQIVHMERLWGPADAF